MSRRSPLSQQGQSNESEAGLGDQHQMPRVSVIIPTYNRPALLREALRSVSTQTYQDFEIIVVDDGSTSPGVQETCREFAKCRYIRQENAGRSSARNRGIQAARGEMIAFLDDDDLWKSEKLGLQVAFLDQNPDVGLVHSPMETIDAAGRLTGGPATGVVFHPEWRSGSVFRYAVRGCVVKSPTPLVRKDVFQRCGTLDTNLSSGEDWEFWARAAYHYRFGYIPQPLAYYRVHADSTTRQELYLGVPLYIARKLCAFVEPKDRSIVRKQSCQAYLSMIGPYTAPRSVERLRHLLAALSLWPASIATKAFWGLLILP